jgi:hypothetical protein
MVSCWECEAKTVRPVPVLVRAPIGAPRRLDLCPSCYRSHYLPLVAEAVEQSATTVAIPVIGR